MVRKSARKSKRNEGRSSSKRRWGELEPERRRWLLLFGGQVLAVVVLVVAVGWGLIRLDDHVLHQPRFSGSPQIVLHQVPPGLETMMQDYLQPLTDVDWIEPTLCQRIAQRLDENPWIKSVQRVRRSNDGQIEVLCDYRQPVAMVQTAGSFVLIDQDQVRLPGQYAYCPQYPLIQGVASRPPQAGRRWAAVDLAAALRVVRQISDEPFADQVTAISVHNYGGREDPYSGHIRLITDRAGGQIIWGSAPRDEVAENLAEQKIAILRRNHQLYGRVDAGRAVIDISTFPDGFVTPAEEFESVAPSWGRT